jgi:hypothetical protein
MNIFIKCHDFIALVLLHNTFFFNLVCYTKVTNYKFCKSNAMFVILQYLWLHDN